MFEGSKPPPKRKSQDKPTTQIPPEVERQQLIDEITKSQNVHLSLNAEHPDDE